MDVGILGEGIHATLEVHAKAEKASFDHMLNLADHVRLRINAVCSLNSHCRVRFGMKQTYKNIKGIHGALNNREE